MPEVESQSTRRSGGESDERLRIRRLRIPVVDNSLRDLDVGMEIPFLKLRSLRMDCSSISPIMNGNIS